MKRLIVMIWACTALSQDVTFQVTPGEIGLNEYLTFSVIVTGQSGNVPVDYPDGLKTGDFRLLSSRPEVRTSYSSVNGKTSTRYTQSFKFQPTIKGKVTFPSQTVKVMGKTFNSQPTDITVQDAVQNLRPTNRRDRFGRRQGPMRLYAEAKVPKTTFYIGEPISYEVLLYQTDNFTIESRGSDLQAPEFQDFWVENLEIDQQRRPIIRDNLRMVEYVIDRRRLFANKTGKLTIEPTRLNLYVNLNSRLSLFSDLRREERSTKPIELTIKPLPTRGRPADFSGAVGRFNLEGNLEADSVKVGEAVSIKIQVAGDGNFGALEDLEPVVPADSFEVFPGGSPETEERGGVVVQKTWVYALVPKRAGELTISLPELAFFDYESESYRIAGGETLAIEVLPGDGLPTGGSFQGERTLTAVENLQFIKLEPLGRLDQRKSIAQPVWLAGIAGGALGLNLFMFLGLMIFRRQAETRQQNRPRYALKNFKRALTKLDAKSEDSEPFYAGLSAAFLNYFGDKWERRGQGISLEYIRDRFQKEGIQGDLIQRVTEVVEACDLARFTPSSSSSREQLSDKALVCIKDLDEVLA